MKLLLGFIVVWAIMMTMRMVITMIDTWSTNKKLKGLKEWEEWERRIGESKEFE